MIRIAEITQELATAIKQDEKLQGRVFPLAATQGTSYPFVIFNRTNIAVDGSKDGIFASELTFEVSVVTATYFEGVEMAEQLISNVLQMDSMDAEFVSSSEEYNFSEGNYRQILTFNLEQ